MKTVLRGVNQNINKNIITTSTTTTTTITTTTTTTTTNNNNNNNNNKVMVYCHIFPATKALHLIMTNICHKLILIIQYYKLGQLLTLTSCSFKGYLN